MSKPQPSFGVDLRAHGPGKAIGLVAGIDPTRDLESSCVDDHDIVVGAASHIGAHAIRLHQDTGGAMSYVQSFDLAARTRVEHRETPTPGQAGHKYQLAVGCELEAVRSLDVGL